MSASRHPQLIKWQCWRRWLRTAEARRLIVRRWRRRMRQRVGQHSAGGDMKDQNQGGDDAERRDAQRRPVTQTGSWGSRLSCGRRARARYFRGHFDCSFRCLGIPPRASGAAPAPARPSNAGAGEARGSPRGAASDAAPRGCAQRIPCASCAAPARLQRSKYASLMPRVGVCFARAKMSARATKRCEIVHRAFIARDKWT